MARSLWTRTGICSLVAVVAAAVMLAGSPATAADGPHPGLPPFQTAPSWPDGYRDQGAGTGFYFGATQNGISGARAAKQWARIPVSVLAADQKQASKPASAPVQSDAAYGAWVYFVSPAGSTRNYGDSMPIIVRTVAFGSIPVVATLQVRQRTGADGLPVGIWAGPSIARTYIGNHVPRYVFEATKFTNNVIVSVNDLRVDGVNVELGSQCETPPTSALTLESDYNEITTTGTQTVYDVFDASKAFAAPYGGRLSGSIDIPAFSGCTTAGGDDLSPLVTATVSGKDNPIQVTAGPQFCSPEPSPGEDTPEKAHCPFFDSYYPGNPNLPTVPYEIDFPDHAP